MKAKILADFQICISVPLMYELDWTMIVEYSCIAENIAVVTVLLVLLLLFLVLVLCYFIIIIIYFHSICSYSLWLCYSAFLLLMFVAYVDHFIVSLTSASLVLRSL